LFYSWWLKSFGWSFFILFKNGFKYKFNLSLRNGRKAVSYMKIIMLSWAGGTGKTTTVGERGVKK